jgi:hypothetical protein
MWGGIPRSLFVVVVGRLRDAGASSVCLLGWTTRVEWSGEGALGRPSFVE